MSLLDLSFVNLKPPLITIDNGTIQDILDTIENNDLNATEKNILSSIKYILDDTGKRYCNAEDVGSYLNKKAVTIRYNLKMMTEKGIFREEYCSVNKKTKRRSSLFVFNSKYQQNNSIPPDKIQGDLLSTKNYTSSSLYYEVSNDYGLADNTICKNLFGLLEFNHKNKSSEESASIFINDEIVKTKVSTRSGNRIALVKDLKYYLAILKICEQQMMVRVKSELNGLINPRDVKDTTFIIYEKEILLTIGVGTGTPEREGMQKSLLRLEDTEYHLLNLPHTLMEHFNVDEYNSKIRHFLINEHVKTKDDRIVYVLDMGQKMTNYIYESVKNKQETFTKTDKRLFHVKSSFEFALILGMSDQPIGKIRYYSWQQLNDRICPKMNRLEFMKKISLVLEKYALINNGIKSYEESNKKHIVHTAISVINDIEIKYHYETDFTIQRIASAKILETENKKFYKGRIPSRLDP